VEEPSEFIVVSFLVGGGDDDVEVFAEDVVFGGFEEFAEGPGDVVDGLYESILVKINKAFLSVSVFDFEGKGRVALNPILNKLLKFRGVDNL
jgi:hypothetical protein